MKITAFNKHKPIDRTDPGFTIPGVKLRWVSGKVSENSPGRPWVVITKSDCPKELLEHLSRHNPSAFANGDVYRRGDLCLAYTTEEAHKLLKREIAELRTDQEELVKRAPSIMGRDGKNRASIEVNETKDVTADMIERFKKQNDE